ncbi:cupin domain-containing protein [Rhizobium sp.]|jgi:mannose-6-phosphate isomerase-like protein (cupin superfamily)|uniref:cupin domain-containing protein n=1 Tax=Rhizobium sp. TaxID=391 RepID=UPI000E9F0CA8|nr:cupin domain-containing protein [Rhizobium sp.]
MTEVVRQISKDFSSLVDILGIVPEQGCIEVQRDGPGKVHDWHRHPNEETLIILQGDITFSLESGDIVCGPGDALMLSANDLHKSAAGPNGVVYLIAFRWLGLEGKVSI